MAVRLCMAVDFQLNGVGPIATGVRECIESFVVAHKLVMRSQRAGSEDNEDWSRMRSLIFLFLMPKPSHITFERNRCRRIE